MFESGRFKVASDEIARGRIVSLEVFAPKMRSGVTTFWSWNWLAKSIGSTPTKTIERVCVFVLKWLRTKILNENWRYRVGKKKTIIQWRRITFDKHFMPKLRRQKRNRSSEDSWSKRKLRIIEEVHWAKKGGTTSVKRLTTRIGGPAKKFAAIKERCS